MLIPTLPPDEMRSLSVRVTALSVEVVDALDVLRKEREPSVSSLKTVGLVEYVPCDETYASSDDVFTLQPFERTSEALE